MRKIILHTKALVSRKNIKSEEGIIEGVVGSTSVIDRMGDVIEQSGWVLGAYKKTNPVILWGHNVRNNRPPIGKATKVWIEDTKKKAKLMFNIKFDLQDSFAAGIFRKVKEGYINTVSVGFNPIDYEALDEEAGFRGGLRYLKQELLELSFV